MISHDMYVLTREAESEEKKKAKKHRKQTFFYHIYTLNLPPHSTCAFIYTLKSSGGVGPLGPKEKNKRISGAQTRQQKKFNNCIYETK